MCIWVFDGARNNFERLTAFLGIFCIVGFGVCVVNSSHNFQWIFFKPCILVVDIMKMCIWGFGGARTNFDRITAFCT